MYLNAGGVTVSYFEWLKNLSHVRFGRMSKRFEQASNLNLIESFEKVAGVRLTDEEKHKASRGADEIDLVYSGLEETMINSYHDIRNEWKANDKVDSLRTAAFVVSINKVADDYMALGIFP
jgi:glutamate dehydrogenase (NAD(P)+)